MALVVTESGAPWAGWVERFQGALVPVRLVSQLPGEGRVSLVERVRRAAAALLAAGATIATVVLVGNSSLGDEALAGRWSLVRSLLDAIERGGQLVLAPGCPEDRASRRALEAFALAIDGELRGRGVSVSYLALEAASSRAALDRDALAPPPSRVRPTARARKLAPRAYPRGRRRAARQAVQEREGM